MNVMPKQDKYHIQIDSEQELFLMRMHVNWHEIIKCIQTIKNSKHYKHRIFIMKLR